MGRDSVDCIAISYRLDGRRIESRWWGDEVFHTIQNGPGAHSASCRMGTGILSRGLSGRSVALKTFPHLAPR